MASLFDFGDVIDIDTFDKFSQPHLDIPQEITHLNYCDECEVPMELSGIEYHCKLCGYTQRNEIENTKDHDETVSTSIRITTGANRGRFHNNVGDYTKTQRKVILQQLLQQQSKFTGPPIQINILNATATRYNSIQKMITEDEYDGNGDVKGQKKFVRRGTIKDEILAALLYFECSAEGLFRKKKDIATFMGLATNGFSRGENILRNLEAEGKIELPADNEPIQGFVDRYMEALNIVNPAYEKFVVEIVEVSEKHRIGMNSQISSKIVGAIWTLITKCRLGITSATLEKHTDNTKKNTFMKFCNVISANMCVFAPVFVKHGIPQ
jgi:hypothetical protein